MARILIVDDDQDVLDMLSEMLSADHEVHVTTDTARALELIREGPHVDLLVTDVRMPGRNGFILIQQAKAIRPDLRVIVISAYYDETDERARLIVERYSPIALGKPITRDAIIKAVAAALPEVPVA